MASSASLYILANYNLPLNRALYVHEIMLTRAEHTKRVKQKRLILRVIYVLTISVFLALIINSYLESKNSDIQIVSKWHECKPNNCEYKLEIENTSNLRKSVFVRINAFYRKVHPEGGDTFHVVNSERIEINMAQSSKQNLSGNIKVPLKAHFLKFTVGTI
ncbi:MULTISPECIES: hypothetical protein [unclassified Colwellia]|uniref:hypothetical protein n=2 Tax=Colwellia TaxID=28228 RepID=UPI0015F57FCC|nr:MULTISPECIES: hypothetical protein [unclassified Colwellia]MBA6381301.1 hypothetical protein [Colwellia sp. BRX10-7]MBA6389046.1 hypothetical protein [Colwellia sp. BRX10-2]MBA6403771.1 hypothetical protein [Colwellia sp. BRX10-5]MBA6407653.1 hypothetical protein [Colwellia sp. BRX10-1]